MFCPLCKAEYREGFTHCNDCDVDLVEHLPPSGDDSSDPQSSLGSTELLWSGDDNAFCSRLVDALADANVSSHVAQSAARYYPSVQSAFQVWTLTRDHAAAMAVLNLIIEAEADSSEFGGGTNVDSQDSLPEESPGPDVDDIVENFRPEDATTEVWSGADRQFAENVKMCLQENGIGCVIDDSSPTVQSLRVSPTREVRAREIIREIIECAQGGK